MHLDQEELAWYLSGYKLSGFSSTQQKNRTGNKMVPLLSQAWVVQVLELCRVGVSISDLSAGLGHSAPPTAQPPFLLFFF